MKESGLKFVYIVGTMLGVAALMLGAVLVQGVEFVSALQRALIFTFLGLSVGLLRPEGRWHWGIALALPLVALMAVHVGAADHIHATLFNHDLPLMVGVIAGGTGGSQLGAWLRGSRGPPPDKNEADRVT